MWVSWTQHIKDYWSYYLHKNKSHIDFTKTWKIYKKSVLDSKKFGYAFWGKLHPNFMQDMMYH